MRMACALGDAIEFDYSTSLQRKNVLEKKKDRNHAGAGGLGTKHVDGCAAGPGDGRVGDPVDGARCTKGPNQERHTSTESRNRSIDVSEGSASENGLCAW